MRGKTERKVSAEISGRSVSVSNLRSFKVCRIDLVYFICLFLHMY